MFLVFVWDGKIMFGYCNMMKFNVDQWAVGDFEQRNLTPTESQQTTSNTERMTFKIKMMEI